MAERLTYDERKAAALKHGPVAFDLFEIADMLKEQEARLRRLGHNDLCAATELLRRMIDFRRGEVMNPLHAVYGKRRDDAATLAGLSGAESGVADPCPVCGSYDQNPRSCHMGGCPRGGDL